jgi:hypothetical protein
MGKVVSRLLILSLGVIVSACATTPPRPQARMHSAEELNAIGRTCGLALGELFQDESEKRLLFLFRPDTTAEQRVCVTRWAWKNGLRPVFVAAINFPEG